jgi:hypothetical protein
MDHGLPIGLMATIAMAGVRWLDDWELRRRAQPAPPPITGPGWLESRRAPAPMWVVVPARFAAYVVVWNLAR